MLCDINKGYWLNMLLAAVSLYDWGMEWWVLVYIIFNFSLFAAVTFAKTDKCEIGQEGLVGADNFLLAT